jgi:hypothetical protein
MAGQHLDRALPPEPVVQIPDDNTSGCYADPSDSRQYLPDRLLPPFKAVFAFSIAILTMLPVSFTGYFLADGIEPGFANKDFANYWVSAHLAAQGRVMAVFGDNQIYFDHILQVMGPAMPWHNWSYPPHYLLLMMPLALIGYKAGAVLFILITGAIFWTGLVSFLNGRLGLTVLAVARLQCSIHGRCRTAF